MGSYHRLVKSGVIGPDIGLSLPSTPPLLLLSGNWNLVPGNSHMFVYGAFVPLVPSLLHHSDTYRRGRPGPLNLEEGPNYGWVGSR